METPLWALQYSLSSTYQSNKTYSIEFSNLLELTIAHDGAYIICGYINPDCLLNATPNQRTEYPHDPSYDITSRNERCNEIRTVVLYFPSTGTYYSPRFVTDTSHLRVKGLFLRDFDLSTKTVWQMLPSTALRIKKNDGMPDAEGQLQNFTDVYRIDVRNHCNLLSTLQPILKGVHVNDNHICIPHDVIVGRQNKLVLSKDDTKANYLLLQKIFVDELTKSNSNKAGCKRYVTGSFIA